jgi:hypothetical protein
MFGCSTGFRLAFVSVMIALGNPARLCGQVFQNLASDWNVIQYNWDGHYGAAVSTADWNNDGWPDLTVGTTQGALRTYLNVEGTGFQSVPLPFVMESETKAILWVDLDNDGDDDLFVQEETGRVGVIRNDGPAGFVDVTAESGISFEETETAGASFGDMDNDGDLDLYICRYIEFPGEDDPIHRNVLMRNEGNLVFTDVSEGSGATDNAWLSFQSLWWDHDGDGWQDIYVINDKTGANALFRNLGDGTFEDVAPALGLDVVLDCMTASLADFNLDGMQDMFNTSTPFGGDGMGSKLLVAQPNGNFLEASANHGLNMDRFCWGAAWMDVDNDADLDLFVTEHEFLQPYGLNYLYENGGQGLDFHFSPFAENVYGADYLNSHVVATADFDGNGWVDFVMHNIGNHAMRLWMNTGFDNGYESIRIALEGTISNRPAAGSLIDFITSNYHQKRHTHVGENYLSQESEWELFGLGMGTLEGIQVTWPSGLVEFFHPDIHGLNPGGQYTLVEGSSACPNEVVTHHFCEPSGNLFLPPLPQGATGVWITETGQSITGQQGLNWNPAYGNVTVDVVWQNQTLCSITHVIEVTPLDADFNQDGAVGTTDLLQLLGSLGCLEACNEDLDNDGVTSIHDLLMLLPQMGTSCD